MRMGGDGCVSLNVHLTYCPFPTPSRASFLAMAAALTVTMRTRKVGIYHLGEAPWQGEGQAGLGVSVRAQARGLTAGMSLSNPGLQTGREEVSRAGQGGGLPPRAGKP